MRRNKILLGGVALGMSALVACAGSDRPEQQESAGPTEVQQGDSRASAESGPTSTVFELEGSRVKTYETLAEVWADSELIVRGRAISSGAPERPAGGGWVENSEGGEVQLPTIPQTVTTFAVDEVLVSRNADLVTQGSEILIRQMGTLEVPMEDSPILADGSEYVLLLDEFEFGPDDKTGEFVITGSAGGYLVNGQGTLTRLDELSVDLPDGIGQEELVAEATR